MDRPSTNLASVVDASRIDGLCDEARNSPRRRAHLLLHSGHEDPVQRLVIAVEPGTYIRAHKHSEQWEMLVLLRGEVDVLMLSDDAKLQQRVSLNATAPVIQIPLGQCHCAVAIQPGSVVMEIKPGPYRPNEFMPWAPAESSSAAGAFVEWAVTAVLGRRWVG